VVFVLFAVFSIIALQNKNAFKIRIRKILMAGGNIIMKKEDLIALVNIPELGGSEVREIKAVEEWKDYFSVDLNAGRWSYKEWTDIPIGEARELFNQEGVWVDGVIGIYDRRNPEHLTRMLRHSEDVTGRTSHADPEDPDGF
jgi:hypothetical protein